MSCNEELNPLEKSYHHALNDMTVLESIIEEPDKDVIVEKLVLLKENLYFQHPENLEFVQSISQDIEEVIKFVQEINKIKEQKTPLEEEWELIDDTEDSEYNKYLELLKKVSQGYMKLCTVYNTTSDIFKTIYDGARPLFTATQMVLSLYHGGTLSLTILLWSWFTRK